MYGEYNPRMAFIMTAHAPAANTAAVVTLAARADPQRRLIKQIDLSISGTADTAPTLVITGLETGTYAITLTAALQVQQLRFDEPLKGIPNTAVVATLTPNGASAVAKINVIHDV